MNKLYLLASGKAAIDLVRRTTLTIKSKCCGGELREKDKASIGENALFLCSFATSLIFAEIGGKALSFLELPGEITGFVLSQIVYFATRYAGANMFFKAILDKNQRLKQHYLSKLDVIKSGDVTIEMEVDASDDGEERALVKFLGRLDEDWHVLPKDRVRQVLFNYPISKKDILSLVKKSGMG